MPTARLCKPSEHAYQHEKAAARADAADLAAVKTRYAVALPPLVRGADQGTSVPDAVARQFLPDKRELRTYPFELSDPIGDHTHTPVPGIVHRYPDRVLFKIVSACPVYCRFCFRREMIGPGKAVQISDTEISSALAYVKANTAIKEVIFTGGDPLILPARKIAALTKHLSVIPHIKKIRWHSRVPILTPDRMTKCVIAALSNTSKRVRVAVHANHPGEFTEDAYRACEALSNAGIELLSQSVLLAGVNDDVATLLELFSAFERARINPYYLHQLDYAPGTHHFRVSIFEGQRLMHRLGKLLPISQMPRYMLDIPGGYGKIELNGKCARLIERRSDGDLYRLCDPFGRVRSYLDPAPQS